MLANTRKTPKGKHAEGTKETLEEKADKVINKQRRQTRKSWMAEALAELEEAKFEDDNITWEEVLEEGVA